MSTNNVINANTTSPLPVGDGGTGANTLTIHGLLKGDAAGAVSALPAATNGQLPIGSTAADPVLATITAGSGITVTNGAGSITIAASGGGGGGITTLTADDTNTATGATVTIAGDTTNIFTTANNASTLTISQGPALVLPATDAGLAQGVISVGGQVIASFAGSDNVYLGPFTGNGVGSSFNVGVGAQCLTAIASGTENVALGLNSLTSLDNGNGNVSIGHNACTTLNSNTAVYNVGIGEAALSSLGTGSANVAIGLDAGAVLTGSETSNIYILNNGVTGESNTIRIGTQGTTLGQQNVCAIAGIFGATVDVGSGVPVVIDNTGLLGTVVSSARFKKNITDMGDRSSKAMNLRPVNFSYKEDVTNSMQFGLIAEEVAEVMPELVVYDGAHNPHTVRYHELPSILLNEVKKLAKRVDELEAKLAQKGE
jgi:hypothetical protein